MATKTLPHGLPFAPVKVGVLIDIDMGGGCVTRTSSGTTRPITTTTRTASDATSTRPSRRSAT